MSSWQDPIDGGFVTWRPLGKLPSEIDWSKPTPKRVVQRAPPPPEEKVCPSCKRVMYRRDFNRSTWERKRFCSNPCRHAAATPLHSTHTVTFPKQQEKTPKPVSHHTPTTKPCAQCGVVFPRPKLGCTIAAWNARRCCSKRCAALARAHGRSGWETVKCVECGTAFRAPTCDHRQFCGMPCQHRWMRGRPKGSKAS